MQERNLVEVRKREIRSEKCGARGFLRTHKESSALQVYPPARLKSAIFRSLAFERWWATETVTQCLRVNDNFDSSTFCELTFKRWILIDLVFWKVFMHVIESAHSLPAFLARMWVIVSPWGEIRRFEADIKKTRLSKNTSKNTFSIEHFPGFSIAIWLRFKRMGGLFEFSMSLQYKDFSKKVIFLIFFYLWHCPHIE